MSYMFENKLFQELCFLQNLASYSSEYRIRGIEPSEMLLFLAAIEEKNFTLYFHSGIYKLLLILRIYFCFGSWLYCQFV